MCVCVREREREREREVGEREVGGGSIIHSCGFVSALGSYEMGCSGLPLVSILRRSLGLPATNFRGSPGSFKGSSLI